MALLKRLQSVWADRGPQPSGTVVEDRPAARVAATKLDALDAFPKFRLSAGDQIDPRLHDRLAETRRRLRDAFTPSQPVNDRSRFAGRVGMLTDLIRAIEDERLHVVVYGRRGIGKTSLLHVLAQAAAEARYRIAYVSCGAGSNLDETFRAVCRSVPLLFHADYGPTSPEGERGATFADLLGSAPVTTREASELMAKVTGTRLIVMLDEFDRIESTEFRCAVAEFIKNLSDRLVRVQLVIAGVAANLTELLAFTPSIQRALFAVEAPPMSPAEIRQLVELGERAAGLSFEDSAIETIADSAAGMPYLSSLLSHHAALTALDDGRLNVTREDVATALDRAVAEIGGRLPEAMRRRVEENGQDISGLDDATGLHGRVVSREAWIRTAEGGDTGSHFLEEGLAAYVWLNAARSRASGPSGRPKDSVEIASRAR